MNKLMTTRQVFFVSEYLKDGNGTQAAIRAGYSPRTAIRQASRLLTKAHIEAAVLVGQEKKRVECDRTAREILSDVRRCGEHAEAAGHFNAALRALELEAKLLGLFIDRKELSGPHGQPIKLAPAAKWDLSKLDDDELDTLKRLTQKVAVA